ncbi:AraC family transcriptional regulator [uncultured Microscilla sp.]|uniref:helix-turn-helix domain-containing protein n=1 Tax=uncultured Microscilla sp. TaxID=432653 RepID=UPI0026129068|nr:helix-turn-helix domain-containing protein [uncultured Microscilla sp.]
MKTKLYAQDLEDIVLENKYPRNYFVDSETGIVEKEFSGDLIGTKGSYREIFLENIHIGYGHLQLKNDLELVFESDFETVEMHFLLQGDTLSKDKESFYQFNFTTNQSNIIYANGFRGKAKYVYQSKSIRIFEVNLIPTFFTKYLPEASEQLYQFLKHIDTKNTTTVSQHNYQITPQMYLIIQDIIQCNRVGIFKKMFIESKIIELLMLQLEQIINCECQVCSVSKKDQEKMYAVREIIHKNIDKSTTLIDLARKVGTNEFTLKKGFKEIFGTTVFGYWNDLKMQIAKQMLLNENAPVSRVAEKIGYKNPQHFTVAFKRKYGITPGKLKQQRL